MKKSILLPTLIALNIIGCGVFTERNRLHINETFLKPTTDIQFNDPMSMDNRSFSSSMSSYDGSTFSVFLSYKYRDSVTGINPAMGIHQSELEVFECGGSLSTDSFGTTLVLNSFYHKIYLIKISKEPIVDSFVGPITVRIETQALDNTESHLLYSTTSTMPIQSLPSSNFQLLALPVNADLGDRYKAVHKKRNVAIFSRFDVSDANGKSISYGEGDYLIIGSQGLTLYK